MNTKNELPEKCPCCFSDANTNRIDRENDKNKYKIIIEKI
jgi:hypothetical protein